MYKARDRAKLQQAGYRIGTSIGDQVSDMAGGPLKSGLLLPNPIYLFPQGAGNSAGSGAAVALPLGIKTGDHVKDDVKNRTRDDSAKSVSSRASVSLTPNYVKEPRDSKENHHDNEQLDELNSDFHLCFPSMLGSISARVIADRKRDFSWDRAGRGLRGGLIFKPTSRVSVVSLN